MPELPSSALSAPLWVIFCHLILSRCSTLFHVLRSLSVSLSLFLSLSPVSPYVSHRLSNFPEKTPRLLSTAFWHVLCYVTPTLAICPVLSQGCGEYIGPVAGHRTSNPPLETRRCNNGLFCGLHEWPNDDFSSLDSVLSLLSPRRSPPFFSLSHPASLSALLFLSPCFALPLFLVHEFSFLAASQSYPFSSSIVVYLHCHSSRERLSR